MHAFSSLSGLLGRDSAPLTGKSGVADAFAGLFELLTSLCVRACPTRPFGPWTFLAFPCAVLRF